MTPIVQRMGLPQKRAATTRQMMPTVIKCASDDRVTRQPRLYPPAAPQLTRALSLGATGA